MRGARMHHAWIFHGPVGVGKATAAVALSKVLLCHAPKPEGGIHIAACGQCESCRLLATEGAAHPDLHIITKELAGNSVFSSLRNKKQMNISVELLRERMIGGWIDDKYVESIVGKTAMLRHNKVFIIDEAELLDGVGQNTLLKTLEEPPAGTFIFLVTAHEDRLLPTIRSRCQRVPFAPLEEKLVASWTADYLKTAVTELERQIAEIGEKTKPSKDDQERVAWMQQRISQLRDPGRATKWIVPLSRGSFGQAKMIIDHGMDQWAEAIAPMVQQVAAGKPVPEMGKGMLEMIESYAVRWVDEHDNASKDAANKAGVRYMLGMIGELCRRKLHELSAGSAATVEEIEQRSEPWLRGIDLLQQAERELESNVSMALLMDNLAIQWPHSVASAAR